VASGFSRTGTDIRPMIPLGQFRDTFIIAIDDEGIAIIDQRRPRARVVRACDERLTSGPLESQGLLVPMVLDLPSGATRRSELFHGALAWDSSSMPSATDAEGDGGTGAAQCRQSAALRALPKISKASIRRPCPGGRAVAATMLVTPSRRTTPDAREMLHISMNCGPPRLTVCPHGRPVMLRLTRGDRKNFDRI
jgi:DNA mismatch repair ATPase MutL